MQITTAPEHEPHRTSIQYTSPYAPDMFLQYSVAIGRLHKSLRLPVYFTTSPYLTTTTGSGILRYENENINNSIFIPIANYHQSSVTNTPPTPNRPRTPPEPIGVGWAVSTAANTRGE
ncbi:MAG: hypothetical protein JWM47_4367 [Acidimicrobiales bacterium]|nr:hypothetical protein [Acidimicrobiales bacterium]